MNQHILQIAMNLLPFSRLILMLLLESFLQVFIHLLRQSCYGLQVTIPHKYIGAIIDKKFDDEGNSHTID
jgi:hypothetical protein